MSFPRRFAVAEGSAEPMPVVRPLNALYLFPWTAILLTRLLFPLAR